MATLVARVSAALQAVGAQIKTLKTSVSQRVLADALGRVPTSKVGFSLVNRLFNPNLRHGTLGYSFYYNNSTVAAAYHTVRSKQYAPQGENSLQIYIPGVMPAGTLYVVKLDNVQPDGTVQPYWPVEANGLYDFSAGVSAHRGNGYVYINWVNSSGNTFAQNVGSIVLNNGADGGSIENFPRSKLLVAAPVGAVGAHLLLAVAGTGGSETYGFFSNMMFARAVTGQEECSPYVEPYPGTITVNPFGSGDRTLTDRLKDLSPTPYDFMTNKTDRDKIRTGAADAPVCDGAMAALFAAWSANGGRIEIPDGEWIFNAAQEALLFSPGNNRKYEIHFSAGAKLIPSAANRYRYAVVATWDPNSQSFPSGAGNLGDVVVVVGANNFISVNGITNVNVGDHLYSGPNGWQKILCRANYRYQFWDASTNSDGNGNLVILPGIGDEGDCFIVGKAGTANIDGTNSWALGDEVIYVRGKWRKKNVQGGTYKGVWNPNTNTPTLDNTNGTAGDWYVVGGTPAYAPIGGTGLGESITFVPGEKIWCVAPGRWEKVYASPLFRGVWNPTTDMRRQKWYPSGAVAEQALASQGGYGSTYEITRPGAGTVGPMTRSWLRGEFIFRGANGWERILRDPNWDRGLIRFIQDEKSSLTVTGKVHICSRADFRFLKEWSEGVYIRSHSTSRADYANYLYQGVMLEVDKLTVAGDSSDAELAQSYSGICEGVWEVRNLYVPTFHTVDILVPFSPGGTRRLEEQNYPRLLRFGVRHIDSYVPLCYHFKSNGGFLRSYSVESEVWSVEQPSWEGGYLRIDGANSMTAAYIGHGLRATPALFEPTFEVECGDLGFSRYGVHLKGRQGTLVTAGKPIMPGTGGGQEAMVEQPAFLMIEDCCDIRIADGMPTAGSYYGPENFSAFLRTRGGIHGVSADGISFQEMPAGMLYNLRHNNNTELPFCHGYRDGEVRVEIGSIFGHSADTATRKTYYSLVSMGLVKGEDSLNRKNFIGGAQFGPIMLIGGSDRVYFRRISDGVNIASIDINGTLRHAGPIQSGNTGGV